MARTTEPEQRQRKLPTPLPQEELEEVGKEEREKVPWLSIGFGKTLLVGPLKKAHVYRIHNNGPLDVKIFVDGVETPPPLKAGGTRDVEAEKSIEVQGIPTEGVQGSPSPSGYYQGPLS